MSTVSVIIPTYHRPEMLRRAVASVLAQELRDATFEVIIGVSDRDSSEDRMVATELTAADSRVRMTVAERLGPAAARNAAMAAASGDIFAFTDDDCEAAPGWLQAGVDLLARVDFVQGRTVLKEARANVMVKNRVVERFSGSWEACNLFVRRSAVDRVGGFDEEWNPTGRPERPWGEDMPCGWGLVRAGATYDFEPRAEVRHAIRERTYRQLLRDKLDIRFYPLMVRREPEVRRGFYGRYFLNRQHALITVSLGVLGAAAVAAVKGSPWLALAGFVPAIAMGLSPPRTRIAMTIPQTVNDWINYVMLVYGSIRYRRLVL